MAGDFRVTVEAVVVNHNTSPFAELCLRSLRATELGGSSLDALDLRVTVADNHSTDAGLPALRVAADECGAAFETSRWPHGESTVNTHGDVLRDFVLTRRGAAFYLFLDADIAFLDHGTVARMLQQLSSRDDLWAVQARFASAEKRKAGSSLDIGAGQPWPVYAARHDPGTGGHTTFPVAGTGKPRCHPGCALVRNSPTFQRVAETIGFATAILWSQDEQLAGFFDTMALASTVMAAHGLSYELAGVEVVHYFNVSYDQRTDLTAAKLDDCERRLALLRADPSSPPPPGPWGPWE